MSKKFKFDFQRLLNLRERVEEQKAYELQEARNKENQAENALQKLLAEKENLIKTHETTKRRKVAESIARFQVVSSYMRKLGDDITVSEKQMVKSREETELKRKELMVAVQSKEVMNNLREKRRDQFRKIENRRDLGEEAELAIRMHFHQQEDTVHPRSVSVKEEAE